MRFMGITVISQTTAERREETRQLFEQIKPLLDDGYTYSSALIKIGRTKKKNRVYQQAWFRELKEYGEQLGYPYHKYKGKRGKQ